MPSSIVAVTAASNALELVPTGAGAFVFLIVSFICFDLGSESEL